MDICSSEGRLVPIRTVGQEDHDATTRSRSRTGRPESSTGAGLVVDGIHPSFVVDGVAAGRPYVPVIPACREAEAAIFEGLLDFGQSAFTERMPKASSWRDCATSCPTLRSTIQATDPEAERRWRPIYRPTKDMDNWQAVLRI